MSGSVELIQNCIIKTLITAQVDTYANVEIGILACQIIDDLKSVGYIILSYHPEDASL